METTQTTYKVAGIDVHKSMLAVVIADAAAREGEFQFERRKFGATESTPLSRKLTGGSFPRIAYQIGRRPSCRRMFIIDDFDSK